MYHLTVLLYKLNAKHFVEGSIVRSNIYNIERVGRPRVHVPWDREASRVPVI